MRLDSIILVSSIFAQRDQRVPLDRAPVYIIKTNEGFILCRVNSGLYRGSKQC